MLGPKAMVCSTHSYLSLKTAADNVAAFYGVRSYPRFMRLRSPRMLKTSGRSQVNTRLHEKEHGCNPDENVKAPLLDALVSAAGTDVSGFHFPGHNRGRAAPPLLAKSIGKSPFQHDLPELPELDNLFSPEGAIAEAQQRAARLFGAEETWFLVGGTTCGIQASIMATCSPDDILVLPRNSHMSVFSAMVLSGVFPKYIIPEYEPLWSLTHGITPTEVQKALDELSEEGKQAAAVFLTSPTYFGICSDIEGIANICHSYGVPLIVDEAHGAHFKFHSLFPKSALDQGADIAVQSTHKVLCSLTQSAMLHIQGNRLQKERFSQCLQTLQSSSPSYLLLASLDATCAYIAECTRKINPSDNLFKTAIDLANEAKTSIRQLAHIHLLESKSLGKSVVLDPLRITLGFWELGLQGYKADDILRLKHGVIAELPTLNTLTFAISLGTSSDDILRLVGALDSIAVNPKLANRMKEKCSSMAQFENQFPIIKQKLSPRDAFFARKTRVAINNALGKICGELICAYPPGIPILIPGEIISENVVFYLQNVIKVGATITGASDSSMSSILVCAS